MRKYHVRELLYYNQEQIFALPDEDLEIEFDDGSALVASARSTILSWHGWHYFRIDSSVLITSDHHFGSTIVSKGSELKFLGLCQRTLAKHLEAKGVLTIGVMEELQRLTYYLQNMIYNNVSTELEEYVTTLSALDILEVVDHPVIKKINEETKPTQESLARGRKEITRILAKTHDELPNNRFVRQIRIGGTDVKQAIQIIAPVGYRTEISSDIFSLPIMSGFAYGLKNLYEIAIESRSASKALMFTKAPLADTQYFNREMQLMTCVVQNLYHGEDCGSTIGVPFHVTNNSLEILDGKYHIKEDGSLELITEQSEHLIGTTVRLRSPMTCLKHVCGRCVGELQWSIPSQTNIGHACVVELCEKISQLVLSVKHVDSSSSAEEVIIGATSAAMVERGLEPNEINLRGFLRNKNARLQFSRHFAYGLGMLNRINPTEWSSLSIWDISAMSDVVVVMENKLGEVMHPVSVSMGSRLGSFSLAFLAYLARSDVRAIGNGEMYEVDLSGWDFDKAVWQLPLRHRNMIEFKQEIEEFIKCGGKNSKKGQHLKYRERLEVPITEELMGDVLKQFHELVSSKLKINIVHLEVTLLATMVRQSSKLNPDYRLPPGGVGGYFGSYNDLIAYRSLAPAMAYESQRSHFINMDSFGDIPRPGSPLDPIMKGVWSLDRSL